MRQAHQRGNHYTRERAVAPRVSDTRRGAAPKNGGILLVTHYQRMLNYVKPDRVHVMMAGQIVRSGGPELALELEEKGYDWLEPEPAHGVGA